MTIEEGYEGSDSGSSSDIWMEILGVVEGLISGQTFTAGRDKARAETERKKLAAEDKRRFAIQMKEQRRGTNLAGIEMLKQGREKAEGQSRVRRFMRKLAA